MRPILLAGRRRGEASRHDSDALDEMARPTCSARVPTPYIGPMNAIHLTDTEVEMARHALQAYLQTFGHDEADTVREIRRVIAKLQAAEVEDDDAALPA
jgi:hypothetical protein